MSILQRNISISTAHDFRNMTERGTHAWRTLFFSAFGSLSQCQFASPSTSLVPWFLWSYTPSPYVSYPSPPKPSTCGTHKGHHDQIVRLLARGRRRPARMHVVEDRARDGLDVLRLAEPAVQEEEHGDGVGGRRRVRLREDVEDDACDGQCLFRDCGLSMARLATGRCQYACLGGRILPSLPP